MKKKNELKDNDKSSWSIPNRGRSHISEYQFAASTSIESFSLEELSISGYRHPLLPSRLIWRKMPREEATLCAKSSVLIYNQDFGI
jgi:hypothetical protein